jgi:hypothetical protein
VIKLTAGRAWFPSLGVPPWNRSTGLEGVHQAGTPDAKLALPGWARVTPGGRVASGRGALRGVSP